MDKFQVGDIIKAKKTSYFCDNTVEHAGDIIEITDQTFAYYTLFSDEYELISRKEQ